MGWSPHLQWGYFRSVQFRYGPPKFSVDESSCNRVWLDEFQCDKVRGATLKVLCVDWWDGGHYPAVTRNLLWRRCRFESYSTHQIEDRDSLRRWIDRKPWVVWERWIKRVQKCRFANCSRFWCKRKILWVAGLLGWPPVSHTGNIG